MVICKFYQQGTCKFGNNCRFEHPRSDYSASGESVLRGRYGGHQYTTNNYYGHAKNPGSFEVRNKSHDLEDGMRSVIQEVLQSEKGGQWPLSCFAPIKERPCFPGWEDCSPEEIRWKMYEAIQNGTLPECQRQIKELYDAAKLRRHHILNPNIEVFKIIEKLLQGENIETEKSFSFLQSASQVPWSSGFGNNQQQPSASSNFVFSLPQLGGSSGQNTVQQQPSVFHGSSVIPNVSANVFPSSSEIQAPFGTAAQDFSRFQQSSFTAGPSSTVFGGNNNVFSSAATWNKLDNTVADSSLYTPKTELSQDEMNGFVAQTFTMGRVPTKPPPKEFCTL